MAIFEGLDVDMEDLWILIRGFHKWGYPKMEGFKGIKMDDSGVPLFQETSIWKTAHLSRYGPGYAMMTDKPTEILRNQLIY